MTPVQSWPARFIIATMLSTSPGLRAFLSGCLITGFASTSACFKGDSGLDEIGAEESTSETGDGDGDCTIGALACVCGPENYCDAGLTCDAGTCIEPPCGNGELDEGEECDDGNVVDTDACRNDCVLPICGDMIVDEGEDCDDGNNDDTDACTDLCVAAACGDGIIQIDEGCDDGNTNNFDECGNDCNSASCGDGTINGTDECDDGNDVNTDQCTNACELPICGDGILSQNEDCDDGNQANNDWCTNECVPPSCGGLLFDPGNGIVGCWYTAPVVDRSCTEVCANRGGFNGQASQHTGNAVGKMFYPNKVDRGNWMTIECSSVDNNSNWGANGQPPDPAWSHTACHVNCACNQ